MARKLWYGRYLTLLCTCLSLLLLVTFLFLASVATSGNTEAKVGRGQLLAILTVPSIQRELGLIDEQIVAILKINANQGATTFAEAIDPLNAILDEDQLIGFKSIAFQGLMVRAFTIAEVQQTLELTPDQMKAIAAVQSNLKTNLQPFQDKINKGGNVHFVSLDRDTDAIHEEAYVEALKLLTTAQRKKWEEIARPVPLRQNRG